jgi:ubiquinone/menaquinone biosynthesis C-methylase UbiE
LGRIDDLRDRIHLANVNVHRFEAKCYELIHGEIYGSYEQKRINSTLKRINKLIIGNQKKALDFGAGIGNITGKLLRRGYTVTAVDISPDMCAVMKKQFENYYRKSKLKIINSSIEDTLFDEQEFDLIACYSVLHHLPDYEKVIRTLSTYLRVGGIMYLDHESLRYSKRERSKKTSNIDRLGRRLHFQTNSLLNNLFLKIRGVTVPSMKHVDYSLSDYWIFDEHPIDLDEIVRILQKENFSFIQRINYHLNRSWIFSPTFYLYKQLCKPDYGLWIARK